MSDLTPANLPIPMPLLPKWDPWILKDGDVYRLFYLSGRTDQEPWWKTSWICEAQSLDMRTWEHLGPVLEPLVDKGWESGRLFAGSAYQESQVSYLFYSAASEQDIAEETIGLAISLDGLQWKRFDRPLLAFDRDNVVVAGYAGRSNWSDHLHWRDPYVVYEPESRRYYLFFCASLTGQARYQGGVGLAVADQLAGPYKLLPPAAGPSIGLGIADSGLADSGTAGSGIALGDGLVEPVSGELPGDEAIQQDHWPFYHLERPQVIFFKGQYHLFFSCFKAFVNPRWLEKIGVDKVTDSTLYWYVSDHITGPFEPSSDLPVVPGSEVTGLYGTTFTHLPNFESWAQMSQAGDGGNAVEMTVLGWYYKDYRLAVEQEFVGCWDDEGLRILAMAEQIKESG
jgi:hypothetical protein